MVAANIGSNVGERVPDFELTLVDGSTVSFVSLMESDRPTFLFFFSTF